VWLTLGIGAIGFGGMFCVYTYLASTMLEVTHASPAALPVVLAVFGAGMTVGTLVCAWAADRAQMPAIGGVLLWSAGRPGPLSAGDVGSLWTLIPVVFLIGCGGGLGAVLQTRLMDVAGDAQTLAAALNHSAFNFANALGPWLGGLAIAAGYGWASTGWVGAPWPWAASRSGSWRRWTCARSGSGWRRRLVGDQPGGGGVAAQGEGARRRDLGQLMGAVQQVGDGDLQAQAVMSAARSAA
jgi:predicted MFS family arabinose efflux permease